MVISNTSLFLSYPSDHKSLWAERWEIKISSLEKIFEGRVLGVPIFRNSQDAALEEKKIEEGGQYESKMS